MQDPFAGAVEGDIAAFAEVRFIPTGGIDRQDLECVGAGDAFCGGLIFALCGGIPPQEVVELAVAASASSTAWRATTIA